MSNEYVYPEPIQGGDEKVTRQTGLPLQQQPVTLPARFMKSFRVRMSFTRPETRATVRSITRRTA